jgi:hypothetical protein
MMCGTLSEERWICNLIVQFLLSLAWAVTLGSESRRTHNHILLSHLRLPPTWRARPPYFYPPGIPTPGTRDPFHRLLRLIVLRWRYSNPPPLGHEDCKSVYTFFWQRQ